MNTLQRVLKFLSLTDRSHNLSVTNIAVIVIITKIAISAFDWPTAAALMVTLLNYSHKRVETAKVLKAQAEADAKAQAEAAKPVIDLAPVINQVNEVASKLNSVEKVVSQMTLANTFQRPLRKPQE